jgi:hypothetical protein
MCEEGLYEKLNVWDVIFAKLHDSNMFKERIPKGDLIYYHPSLD